MPADGAPAAYKRDFGTSRRASRAKDYNSFRRAQKGAQYQLLAPSGRLATRYSGRYRGEERTSYRSAQNDPFDPKRTFAAYMTALDTHSHASPRSLEQQKLDFTLPIAVRSNSALGAS
jgi:hypothetical protein